MTTAPQNWTTEDERRFRHRGALVCAGWTMLMSIFSPITLFSLLLTVLAVLLGISGGFFLMTAVTSALIGGVVGLTIAPIVAAVVLLRGQLTLWAVTGACLCAVALLCFILLATASLNSRSLEMAAIWAAFFVCHAWVAFWIALRVPLLRRYVLGSGSSQ